MMVTETAWTSWFVVWQSPYHQHGQSNSQYDPAHQSHQNAKNKGNQRHDSDDNVDDESSDKIDWQRHRCTATATDNTGPSYEMSLDFWLSYKKLGYIYL